MIEWEELLYATAERFDGALPHPETAAELAAAYNRAPHAVLKAIDRAATEYAEGAIRSPWGILRSRVKDLKQTTAAAGRVQDRDKAIARAEQWIRTTGLHYDRESEIEDELYGQRGRLRDHPETRDRLLELWAELRPAGQLVEHEAEQRGRRYIEQRAQLKPTPTETSEQRVARQKAIAAIKGADTTPLTR